MRSPRRPRILHLAPALILVIAASRTTAGETPDQAHANASEAPPERFTDEQKSHWAYQPIVKPEPPPVRLARWVRNPIDRFILAELEAADLTPSAEADRVALMRRLTYDLTGLPPRPEEVSEFLADRRPDAYERLVDRLLESPHYGERWAQHWLDLAHYADSNGFELDAERPDAWRYRDWVVRALNADMPYDRFVADQVAGDERRPGDSEALIATGFLRCGPRELVGGNVIPEVKRQNELTEITGTVGSVFLGLTVACARCHDHKFDAIPATDYYRLQSFFAGSDLVELPIASKAEIVAYEAALKAIEAKAAPLRARMAELEKPYRKSIAESKNAMLTPAERGLMAIPAEKRTPEQKTILEGLQSSLRITWEEVAAAVAANPADHARRESLKRAIYEIERTKPRPPAHAMSIVDPKPTAPETHVFRRGDYRNRGPKVGPRPPGIILASQKKTVFTPDSIRPGKATTGRRSALAAWLASPDNPLPARVIANRVWQYHMTRGIVPTSSDFGVRGEPPSHPELLDWLASELVAGGWRLKPLHRLIVSSATYRQSSRPGGKGAGADPDNTLYGRMNRRRLDAEGVRDAMLAASGELNPRMGGPGVLAPIEKEVKDLIFTESEEVDLWPVDRDTREHARRSLYLFRKRNVRYPLLESFDSPDAQFPCPRRENSTHALQALNLLNGEFAMNRATALAARVFREAGPGEHARIDRIYRLALCRPPTAAEEVRAAAFLDDATDGESVEARWARLALAMLNCNEFLYVP
ncbi:hypothetical protein OJF2_23160 [Aquisphaera giovannonii]|uniref:Planctomycete cytochrome C n=1 Tax=Aquisphaera giovannonii TaxID=406548 RepID=A0A5B9W0I5_9BACT|nr:DUF1549 and DUF1553 domain-containing protein [Aquisphaera giovannonii]QEH33787.1 hypothetical protein OJF2_23160 [Aquisphaera giovannonii]